MITIGIDPGLSGSLVALEVDFSVIHHEPMPTLMVGKKNRVNGSAVAQFVRRFQGERIRAVLEQVGAMPGQGVSSMFSFGHSAGVIEGVLMALEVPYVCVTPQSWKKSAGLIGKDKDAARSHCARLYPDLRILDLKGKGQAVADAILIARHGMTLS